MKGEARRGGGGPQRQLLRPRKDLRRREREPYLMGEELGELASGLIRTGFVSVMQEGGQIGSSLPSYGLCLLQKPMEEMSGT